MYKNTCWDIQTRVFGNQLAKECNTWTNARSIVRTNFVRQKSTERLCRSSNLSSRLCTIFFTLPGWSKGYDVFRAKLANFGKHQQPTSFCTVLLDFESSSIETSFSLLLVVETGKTYPGVDASFHFSNCDRRSMQRKRKFVNKQPHKEKQRRQQRCFIRHFLR